VEVKLNFSGVHYLKSCICRAFAFRLNKHSALKQDFTSGITARYVADFIPLALAYQFIWFDKTK
jgi:hypothetical protein